VDRRTGMIGAIAGVLGAVMGCDETGEPPRPAPSATAVVTTPGPVVTTPSPLPPGPYVQADRPLPPRLPPRAAGNGWLCMKSVTYENMSSCFRDANRCLEMRRQLGQSGQSYGPCLSQAKAACFTFHSVLQGIDSFDCSATIQACERQRSYVADKMRQDVTELSDCGAVG
jgi:hypothetical protein